MNLSFVLFVATAATLFASGSALSDSEKAVITKMAPSADLVHSVDVHQPDSDGKRLLRTHNTTGVDVDDEERLFFFRSWRKKMLDSEKFREDKFTKWFERGVTVKKARKKLRFDKEATYHGLVEQYKQFRINLNMP